MEAQEPVPVNPPQHLPQLEVSNAAGQDHSNGGVTQPSPSSSPSPAPPTEAAPVAPAAPSAGPAQQQESSSISPAAAAAATATGVVAASSAAAGNHAGEGGGAPSSGAGAGAVTAAAAVKKEGGGSQPPSKKRSREASIPVGLPKNMVRRIMKIGEDTRNISNEALVIVVKASELFLERFAKEAFDHAEKLGRKTIKYRDVSDIRVKDPNLLFLEAVVPP